MKNLLIKLASAPAMIPFLLLLLVLIDGSIKSPVFLDARYLLDKTSQLVPIGFMAIAMTFVIASGQIDLSVASGSVLTMVIAAKAFEAGLPMPMVILLALLVGLFLGLINGLGVVVLQLPALVFTLGTLALYRGIAQVLIEERTIGGFPKWFAGIDYVKIASVVPVPLIVLLVVGVIAIITLTRTTFGRRVLAVGTNENAARYSAVRTDRIKIAVFAISGLSMGIAALFMMSMLRSVDHKQFKGAELIAITAVVLGGTSIFGGRATLPGTIVALLLLVALRSTMGVRNMLPQTQLAVIGGLLISAVLLSESIQRFTQRLARSRTVRTDTSAGGN